jgi:hypothetical protein
MTCTAYDEEKNYCNYLQMKFYTGMEKPCESVSAPDKCPIVLMKEG